VILVRLHLPPASARTPYDRLGDYVPWLAVGIAALAAAIGLARGQLGRRRPGGTAAGGQSDVLTDSRLSG
jgi:hypothetical protein